ncbi:beta-galactosidase trimerization domain-containing protein [Bauldia sp.]|uniref:beta-galactosidase trimerization domain-containing protein n=1 Tax=Bauldia sp. TaxID=2575872 RepID=UPI003BABFF69
MRYRQIHLDFHTSELIPGIGSKFDPADFAQTFSDAHVDSVTLFAKCHHGWSYHPTKVGKTHPHLDFDLLRGQIDALHGAGINAPIYISAGWDELAAREHPGWRVVTPEGSLMRQWGGPMEAGWAFMDFASPYLDYLCDQVEEVMQMFPDGNGIFIDICAAMISCSAWVQTRMEAQGLDWTDEDDRVTFTEQIQIEFFERVSGAVRKYDAERPLFFNFGHIRRGRRDILKYFTHLEIESLPTAFWGYEHFPVSARYIEPLDIPFLGMTGKFHHLWGEMGGYKKPEALLYECGAMLAQGARCSIGDHLHPTGAMDKSSYKAIGTAYAHVAAREPWAVGSRNVAEIGVMSVEAASGQRIAGRATKSFQADEGVVRLLLESKLTFDVLDLESDFEGYRLIILPDVIEVSPELKAKIDAYVAGGGRVLLTGKSGIDPEQGFLFDVGAEWRGPPAFSEGDFLLPREGLRASFVDNPLFMYVVSERIKAEPGASLGDTYDPYFDRAPRHFSGHRNTPNQPEPSGFDAGSEKGGFVYLAHPLFTAYKQTGLVALLEIGEKVIRHALGHPSVIETSLPRAGRATLRHQSEERRYVCHLLHATPALRGELMGDQVQPIQDLVTLRDIDVSVAIDEPATSVKIVPGGEALTFRQDGDRVVFQVPELTGHQMVEIAV